MVKSKRKPSRIPKDLRKQAVKDIIIRNGGDFVIVRVMDEVFEKYPQYVKPDERTIAADIYEIFDVVPKEILQRQKSETAKELLYTDGVMKALLNKIKPDSSDNFPGVEKNEEVITILDAYRRHKEGKIKIAEAYGLKEKVADKTETTVKGDIGWWRDKVTNSKE